GFCGRRELVDPGLLVAPGDCAQHTVDETRSCRVEFDSGLLNGGGNGGKCVDARAKQMVSAESQQVDQCRADPVRRAAQGAGGGGGGGDDGVEQPLGGARGVGQLGRVGGVATGDAAFAK